MKSRPRRGKGRTYTEKQVVEAEAAIKAAYDGPKFEGPIQVSIELYPDHWVVNITSLHRSPSAMRGDVDNYAKLLLDGLQGVAFDNDRQVYDLRVQKAIWTPGDGLPLVAEAA